MIIEKKLRELLGNINVDEGTENCSACAIELERRLLGYINKLPAKQESVAAEPQHVIDFTYAYAKKNKIYEMVTTTEALTVDITGNKPVFDLTAEKKITLATARKNNITAKILEHDQEEVQSTGFIVCYFIEGTEIILHILNYCKIDKKVYFLDGQRGYLAKKFPSGYKDKLFFYTTSQPKLAITASAAHVKEEDDIMPPDIVIRFT